MSTKVSISWDKNFHLYQEIFDVSNVYFKLEGCEFEATNDKVMVQIPIKVWRKMIAGWSLRGWPESEDNQEKKLGEEWLSSLELNLLKDDKI